MVTHGNIIQCMNIYLPGIPDIYKSNVIDWDASNNTLDYSLSSYSDWSKPGGYMEIILERQLRQGLDLFDGIDSINTWSNSLSNNE